MRPSDWKGGQFGRASLANGGAGAGAVLPRRAAAKTSSGVQPDSCLDFLRFELTRKRERLLEIRLALFLLFPGMIACWWGGVAIEIAKRLGIDAPWYTRLQESPAPLAVFAVVLAAAWIGFGKEARQIGREIENLGRP